MVDTNTTEKSEVAVPDPKTTALADTADMFGLGEDNGLSDFAQGDFLVPYIRILQSLSKELQKGHAKYIKGAEAGMFINSATGKTYDGEAGFYAIPVQFGHRFQAWRPNNGGPADDYGDDDRVYKSLTPNDKGKRVNNDGNEVTDANQYYIFIVDPETGDYDMGVLSMSGSQAKKARKWNSMMGNRKERSGGKLVSPPIFYYAYHITSIPESNEQGNWYGFSIAEGFSMKDLIAKAGAESAQNIFEDAKATRVRIKAGEIKAAHEEPDADGLDDDDPTKSAF